MIADILRWSIQYHSRKNNPLPDWYMETIYPEGMPVKVICMVWVLGQLERASHKFSYRVKAWNRAYNAKYGYKYDRG